MLHVMSRWQCVGLVALTYGSHIRLFEAISAIHYLQDFYVYRKWRNIKGTACWDNMKRYYG